MRTIKFRGYSLFENRWVYGISIFNVGTVCSIYEDEEVEKSLLEDRRALGVSVDPETVGQFTGLFDKNGVEIYEGDIVIKKDNDGEKYIVDFLQGMYVIRPYKFEYDCNINEMDFYSLNFYIKSDLEKEYVTNTSGENLNCNTVTLEVIGDIHERKN